MIFSVLNNRFSTSEGHYGRGKQVVVGQVAAVDELDRGENAIIEYSIVQINSESNGTPFVKSGV